MNVNRDHTVTIRSETQTPDAASGGVDRKVHGELTLPVEVWLTRVVPIIAEVAATRAANFNELLRRAEAGQSTNPDDLPRGQVAGGAF